MEKNFTPQALEVRFNDLLKQYDRDVIVSRSILQMVPREVVQWYLYSSCGKHLYFEDDLNFLTEVILNVSINFVVGKGIQESEPKYMFDLLNMVCNRLFVWKAFKKASTSKIDYANVRMYPLSQSGEGFLAVPEVNSGRLFFMHKGYYYAALCGVNLNTPRQLVVCVEVPPSDSMEVFNEKLSEYKFPHPILCSYAQLPSEQSLIQDFENFFHSSYLTEFVLERLFIKYSLLQSTSKYTLKAPVINISSTGMSLEAIKNKLAKEE